MLTNVIIEMNTRKGTKKSNPKAAHGDIFSQVPSLILACHFYTFVSVSHYARSTTYIYIVLDYLDKHT